MASVQVPGVRANEVKAKKPRRFLFFGSFLVFLGGDFFNSLFSYSLRITLVAQMIEALFLGSQKFGRLLGGRRLSYP